MQPDGGILIGPEGAFATGASRYSDSHPEIREPLPRVYVQFQVAGAATVYLALLDSGGHYCILSTELRDVMADSFVHGLGSAELWTAYGRMRGELFHHQIELIADQGDTLAVGAMVLISPDWRGPNVIGYTGVLDRMRFAVDSQKNLFYFGPPD